MISMIKTLATCHLHTDKIKLRNFFLTTKEIQMGFLYCIWGNKGILVHIGEAVKVIYDVLHPIPCKFPFFPSNRYIILLCWNFRTIYAARIRVGIGLSYRPARLHRLAESFNCVRRNPLNFFGQKSARSIYTIIHCIFTVYMYII